MSYAKNTLSAIAFAVALAPIAGAGAFTYGAVQQTAYLSAPTSGFNLLAANSTGRPGENQIAENSKGRPGENQVAANSTGRPGENQVAENSKGRPAEFGQTA